MKRALKLVPAAALVLLGSAIGCRDFLTGGELSEDPNRPVEATNRQIWVGIQTNLWQYTASDMTRITTLWTQQATALAGQYVGINEYGVTESTTNTYYSNLYGGGGLKDIRRLQEAATADNDTLFLGIAQVAEALLMGTGADLFGDIVYSEALKETEVPNPKLDEQLDVYAALQTLLDQAIVNLQADPNGATNVGPGEADLSYGGDPVKWTKLAHTLKARYYLHTAEVDPTAYARVATEAPQGIIDPADNFVAPFSGAAGEENFWYQFELVQRPDHWVPNPAYVQRLRARNDPRLTQYFSENGKALSDERLSPSFVQPLITAQENLLVWAEAAARTGDATTALQQLNAERRLAGFTSDLSASGDALIKAILDEKYVATFQSMESWNDYKRTCFPNLAPVVAGKNIPARLPYDTSEQQTNTSIPPADQQPARNDNDPPGGTEFDADACLAQ